MLREYRERKKITQEKLAEITGIDRKTIFRIENNKTIPRVNNYAKIVIALEMTNEEIIENIKKIALNNKEIEE
jgi:transcriptional regulator with XRE-family HTH domain